LKRLAVKVIKNDRGNWEPVDAIGKLLMASILGDAKVGDEYRMIVEKWTEVRSGRHFRYFMALAQRVTEYNRGVPKSDMIERLKVDFGVSQQYGPGFVPPTRPGRFCQPYPRERPGEFYFIVSLNDYTVAEMNTLVDGVKTYCYENDTPIEDLEVE